MKNIVEVRKELSAVFNSLKDGSMEVKAAGEMINCTGKIINSLKVELEYFALRGEKPEISFLESDSKK